MKNKELKRKLIENGSFDEYRKQRFSYFENEQYDKIDSQEYCNKDGELMTSEEIKANSELKECRKKQVKKIRNQFEYWLNQRDRYDIFFMTFTYDDKKRRKEMKTDQLKRYVIRSISPNVLDYSINIDYGEKNERLHFHGFIVCEKGHVKKTMRVKDEHKNRYINVSKLDFMEEYENKVGFYTAQGIYQDSEMVAKKISRYMAKIYQHSIKVKQSYVSTKKGSQYQEWKKRQEKIKNILNKPFRERLKEENQLINEEMGFSKNESKGFENAFNEMGLKNILHGTKEEIEFHLNELKKKENRYSIWHLRA